MKPRRFSFVEDPANDRPPPSVWLPRAFITGLSAGVGAVVWLLFLRN